MTNLTTGAKIKFKSNQAKMIDRESLDISNLTGVVESVDEYAVIIKLDNHIEDLDEWDNCIIYNDDEIEECVEFFNVVL